MKKTKFIVIVAFFIGLLLLPSVGYAYTKEEAEAIINKIKVKENNDGSCTYEANSIPYEEIFKNKDLDTFDEFKNGWLDSGESFTNEELEEMYEEYLEYSKSDILRAINDFSYIKDELNVDDINIEQSLNEDGTITFNTFYWLTDNGNYDRIDVSKTCKVTYKSTDEKTLKQANKIITELKDEYTVYGLRAITAVYHYGEFQLDGNDTPAILYRFPELKKILSKNKGLEVDLSSTIGAGGDGLSGSVAKELVIKKNGIAYATKQVDLTFTSIIPVDKDEEGTPYEKAVKRIKNHIGENKVKIELNPENPNIDTEVYSEELNIKLNKMFGTKNEEFTGYHANILVNNAREFITIIEVDKKMIDKYDVRANHGETGVHVYTESPEVPVDATIDVEDMKDKEFVKKALKELKYDLMSAFNIDLIKTATGVKINKIEDGIEVYIPVNDKNKGDKLLVHHIKEDGTLGDKFQGEVVEVDGIKYVKFTTTHFSTYAVLDTSDVDSPDTSDSILVSVLLCGLSLITIIESIIAYKKVRKQN